MSDLFEQKQADEAALLAGHHARVGELISASDLEALRLSGDERRYTREAHVRSQKVADHCRTYAREIQEMHRRHRYLEEAARIVAEPAPTEHEEAVR